MSPTPSAGSFVPPIEVDARGLRCPLPVIRLAEAARNAASGTVIVVLAEDPAARHDIPAWCRMRDHELREITEVRETARIPDPPASEEAVARRGTGAEEEAAAAGADPAYLRFVVLIRSQRSKPGGSGSESERSSRAR